MHIILIAGTWLIIAVIVLNSWLNPLTIDNISAYRVDLSITNVQFDNDYLNITVRNIGWNPTVISLVIINQTTFTLRTVPVHEPISAGEIISFRVDFKWTSGYRYQITLETTDSFEKHGCNTFSTVAP